VVANMTEFLGAYKCHLYIRAFPVRITLERARIQL